MPETTVTGEKAAAGSMAARAELKFSAAEATRTLYTRSSRFILILHGAFLCFLAFGLNKLPAVSVNEGGREVFLHKGTAAGNPAG